MDKKRIIRKTILNWRFYLVAPVLILFLTFKLIIKSIRVISKFIDRKLRAVEQCIDHSKILKKLATWF